MASGRHYSRKCKNETDMWGKVMQREDTNNSFHVHTFNMENTQRNLHNVTFKLKAIELSVKDMELLHISLASTNQW